MYYYEQQFHKVTNLPWSAGHNFSIINIVKKTKCFVKKKKNVQILPDHETNNHIIIEFRIGMHYACKLV